jgi:hypothetical protein
MQAPDLLIAALAICLIGEGKYGLTGIEEHKGNNVPIFLLQGHDEWFKENFGVSFERALSDAIKNRPYCIINSLLSVENLTQKTSVISLKEIALDLSKTLESMAKHPNPLDLNSCKSPSSPSTDAN